MKEIFAVLNKLLDFIYKKKCYFCGSSRECVKMCSKCYDELVFASVSCNRLINGVQVFSAGVYEKNLQKMIRGIKYHRQKELAYYMAKFMWEYFQQVVEKEGFSGNFEVVPVPLHKSRERKRGYNHMKLVSDEFCALSGYSANYDLIKRIKNTKPQYKLSYAQKQENLKDAFEVDKSKISGNTVLIIDDICTSGATFSSMIDELKSNGVEHIVCLSTSSPIY
ncbi:MAG: hypothetical protein K6E29_08070 [Cyanobacteria bacterium RUI128]|nr:hypothetical protein [Cyanobacteria bacterium RUI128]